MKKSTSGFTLVEILIVVIIITILASIVAVSYNGAQGRARDSDRRADIANITKALEMYYDDNGAYPIPSATSSVIGNTWYSSGDASWATFQSALSSAMSDVPKDPTGTTNGNPINAGNYAYAYTSGSYCGRNPGQWYLLVYRFEASANTKFSDGDCSTNPLGDTYFTGGSSYYRSTK